MNDLTAKANNLFREWQGFHGKILLYNGSPGIVGRLQILFSSGQDCYFLMVCGSCHNEFETRFNWTVGDLRIEADENSNILHVFDRIGKLNIHTSYLQIYELLDVVETSRMEAKLFENIRRLPSENGLDNFRSLQALKAKLYINDFYVYTNTLALGCKSVDILLHNPKYIYSRNNPTIDIRDIKIEEYSNRVLSLHDNQDLKIECDNIEIVKDWSIYHGYRESSRKQSEWFSGDDDESRMMIYLARKPKEILKINCY